MEGLNTVGHAINNEKSYLDAGCKAFLGCTAVAAFIVKNCIPEFRDMSLEEIQEYIIYKMKTGKAQGFNRGMIGRQLRFSWNKICAKEFHCVSSGRNWRIIFLRSECVQTVNKTLFGLFSH